MNEYRTMLEGRNWKNFQYYCIIKPSNAAQGRIQSIKTAIEKNQNKMNEEMKSHFERFENQVTSLNEKNKEDQILVKKDITSIRTDVDESIRKAGNKFDARLTKMESMLKEIHTTIVPKQKLGSRMEKGMAARFRKL